MLTVLMASACRGSYGKVHDGAWLGVPVAIKTLDLRVDDVGVAQVGAA